MSRAAVTPKKSHTPAREVLALNMIRMRGDLGWSQEELAFNAGLHRTFIAHVERKARNLSLDNLERIAQALGLRVDELLAPPPVMKK